MISVQELLWYVSQNLIWKHCNPQHIEKDNTEQSFSKLVPANFHRVKTIERFLLKFYLTKVVDEGIYGNNYSSWDPPLPILPKASRLYTTALTNSKLWIFIVTANFRNSVVYRKFPPLKVKYFQNAQDGLHTPRKITLFSSLLLQPGLILLPLSQLSLFVLLNEQ